MDFDGISNYCDEIYETLFNLIETPGPSLACARILGEGRAPEKEFPMTRSIKEITGGFEESCNIRLWEDHGNIVLVGGLDSDNPDDEEVKRIPIVLGAHMDEVTYLVTNKSDNGTHVILPLCSPPTRLFHHKEARVLGMRDGELVTVGSGKFDAEEIIRIGRDKSVRMEGLKYLLKVEEDMGVKPGDVAIQDYVSVRKYVGPDSVIEAKALDDRVGTTAVLYALRFLSQRMPIKVILSGDEEGVPSDVSWARLILPTYERYCRRDVVTLLCDGVNGADIKECPDYEGKFLSDALLLPYTANGKGGGDYRLFSILRENVLPTAKENGFAARVLTDYASRSYDPKIMNEFPMIAFIDWSNGLVGNSLFRCHYHEEILLRQVLNIVGCLYWTCVHLSENRNNVTL
ncbi:MAG: hypothetical protein V3U09_00470 [Thermoplasmata archaeon]